MRADASPRRSARPPRDPKLHTRVPDALGEPRSAVHFDRVDVGALAVNFCLQLARVAKPAFRLAFAYSILAISTAAPVTVSTHMVERPNTTG